MLIHHSPNLDHRFDQLLWRYDITKPQGRIEDLAQCSGIDDTADVVETLQTWEWGTRVTKFRVVIVLENVGVTRSREIDQSCPPRETHRHAERKLMGRGHVNYFRRALFQRPLDCDSFPVNRSWHDDRPGEAEGSTSLVKSWILDPGYLTAIYQR